MKWHEYNYKQYIEQTIKRSPQQLIASSTNGKMDMDETTKYSVQHDMVCINVEKEIHDHSVSNSFKTFFTL